MENETYMKRLKDRQQVCLKQELYMRMIILKQCLDHNIVPVIIRDIHKAEYNRYLNKAQHEQDYKGLEAYFEKEQKYYQESTIPMIFDYDEL